MKTQTKLKSLIFSCFCIALSLCLLLVPTNAQANNLASKTYASSPVSLVGDKKIEQKQSLAFVTAVADGANSSTLKLYPESESSELNIIDFFAYYNTDANDSESTKFELINKEKTSLSPSQLNPHNGQFVSTISLSNGLKIAISRGYVTISASSYSSSMNCGKSWAINDQLDDITFSLNSYSSTDDDNSVSVSETYTDRGDYLETPDTLTLSNSDLASKLVDRIDLSIQNKLIGNVANYLKVKEPVVKLETSDVFAPVLSNLSFTKSNNLPTEFSFVVTDSESGIAKVEIKNGSADWQTVKSYSEFKDTDTVTVNSVNGSSVLVRVTDNVGNEAVVPYVFVSAESLYLEDSFDLNSSDISNVGSDFSLKINKKINGIIEGTVSVASNSTPITVSECGNYTFEVMATNKAGNTLYSYEIESLVDFNYYNVTVNAKNATATSSYQTKRATNQSLTFAKATANSQFVSLTKNGELVDASELTESDGTYTYLFDVASNITFDIVFRQKVEITILTNYDFNQNGFVPSVLVKTTDTNQTVKNCPLSFEYFDGDNSPISSILNAGDYFVKASISDEDYYGEATTKITIKPKEIAITPASNQPIEFDGNSHEFEFSAEALESEIVVSYFLNGSEISVPINAGEYTVTLALGSANANYTLSYSSTLTISKRNVIVSAKNTEITYGDIVPEFEYLISNNFDGSGLAFTVIAENLSTNANTYNLVFAEQTSLTSEQTELFKNFNITYTAGTFVINKKQIEVRAIALSKIYGEDWGNNIVLHSSVIDGLLAGDTLTGNLVREAGEDVGFYAVSIGSLSNPNYEITLVPATYSITKRVAFVRINSKSMTYGEAVPALDFDLTYDKLNIISSDIELFNNNLYVDSVTGAGTYTITLQTSNITNYSVVVLDGTLEVNKANLTLPALENKTTAYTGENILINEIEGFTLTYKYYQNGTEVSETKNVGAYTVIGYFAGNNNYNEAQTNEAELVITKANIILPALANKTTAYTGENILIDEIEGFELSYKYYLDGTEVSETKNVGTYTVIGYFAGNNNYNNAQTNIAELVITKADIILPALENKSTAYTGENILINEIEGFTLTYKYYQNGTEVSETKNANTYTVIGYFAGNNNYNEAQTNIAELVITKADIILPALENKTTYYSGSAQFVDELDFEFDLEYVYTSFGKTVENPTNAGKYSVYVIFAGNQNYNSAVSNTAELIINKKIIPITMKKVMFTYNGKQQFPEYEIGLKTDVSLTITFINGETPIEVGEYQFEIRSNDVNYTCEFSGTLKIVPEFYSESESGNASIGISNVGYANSGIQIFEEVNSNLRSRFNVLRDERKCISVYAFKNIESAQGSTEVFTVKIKAKSKKDVVIYSVDSNGNMTEVSYTNVDGYYVLSVNDLSSRLIVTQADSTLFILKVAFVALVLILSVVITKSVKKHKANKFFHKNTVVSFTSDEELEANAQIVQSKIYKSGLSAKDITK